MELVDEKTKKRLRTWELPFKGQPVGVSPDGQTRYFLLNIKIYSFEQRISIQPAVALITKAGNFGAPGRPTHLILAASDKGVQFADGNDLIEGERSETIENQGRNLPHLGYIRFQVRGKS